MIEKVFDMLSLQVYIIDKFSVFVSGIGMLVIGDDGEVKFCVKEYMWIGVVIIKSVKS